MKRLLLGTFLVFVGCGGGLGSRATIVMPNNVIATVTLDTEEMVPGTFIHGEGIGAGGGDVCGSILQVDGYRTNDRVVFRLQDQDGFCFQSDVYEIVLENVVWDGEVGRMLFGNNGDPRAPGFVNGFAFFIPDSTGFGLFVDEISVSQWMDSPGDTWLFLSIPLKRFRFAVAEEDSTSVFQVSAQIERAGAGVIDFTDIVNVDFVDPHTEP